MTGSQEPLGGKAMMATQERQGMMEMTAKKGDEEDLGHQARQANPEGVLVIKPMFM